MIRYILSILAIFIVASTSMASDHIIFRNGRESDVKLYQITDEKIVFGYIGDKSGTHHEVPSKDVFMVYIEKQGNIYITPEGKRITGEAKRADIKKNDVIYLIRGAEIAADYVRITENNICYSVKTKGNGIAGLIGKGNINEATIDKSEVFMIRYRSGMTDIITPIEIIEEETVTKNTAAEASPLLVVIFHEVAKGENLENIASKYNVSPAQIAEWNDLPSRIKPTSPLTAGMQLMIYQPKQTQ